MSRSFSIGVAGGELCQIYAKFPAFQCASVPVNATQPAREGFYNLKGAASCLEKSGVFTSNQMSGVHVREIDMQEIILWGFLPLPESCCETRQRPFLEGF